MPAQAASTISSSEPRLRVLLAEDDAATRRIVAELLAEDGFDVVEARTGVELFAQLDATPENERADAFQVVVADVKMPGFSGIDVLRAVHEASWQVPFVVVTAIQDPAVHAEAKRLGALAVLVKPIRYVELRAALDAALARRAR